MLFVSHVAILLSLLCIIMQNGITFTKKTCLVIMRYGSDNYEKSGWNQNLTSKSLLSWAMKAQRQLIYCYCV